MRVEDLIGNRAIAEETPLYYLLLPDNIVTPNYYEIVPKLYTDKTKWVARIKKHLDMFSDTLLNFGSGVTEQTDQISYVPVHRYYYYYKGGNVEVWTKDNRIAIESNHPELDNVVQGFIKLLIIENMTANRNYNY